MDKKVFYERLVDSLKKIKEEEELDTVHDALIYWVGVNYFLLDSEDVKDRIFTDSFAEGIDSVLVSREEHIIYFITAKTVESFEKTANDFSENDIKLALEGMRLLNGDYKGKITPKLENLTDEFHELDKTGDYKTKLIFLTLKKKVIENKFIKEFSRDFAKIETEFIDFDDLYNFYQNKYLFQTALPPKRISLEIINDVIAKHSPKNARVFSCKGKDLARIYQEHGEAIFQQNVRNMLSMKSKSINNQIVETASSDLLSKEFWYFNNGITMICKKIIDTSNKKSIILESPQIINGAQTTYALSVAFSEGKLKDDVEIIIKIIENNNQEFIDSVTLYTNSQNPIKLRDLCSNDKVQISTQKILLNSYNCFYERKRGEFNVSYPTEITRINKFGEDYKYKVLNNEKLAQAFLSLFLGKPAESKSGKGRIFMKEDGGFYREIFNENDDLLPEKLLLAFLLLRWVENKKKDYNKQYKKAEEKEQVEKDKIYSYDFLLHSEYFILNLFKDFFENRNQTFCDKKSLLEFIKLIEVNDSYIEETYDKIKECLKDFVSQKQSDPKYYHNKFFKNEKGIALVRNHFKSKYKFFEEIV